MKTKLIVTLLATTAMSLAASASEFQKYNMHCEFGSEPKSIEIKKLPKISDSEDYVFMLGDSDLVYNCGLDFAGDNYPEIKDHGINYSLITGLSPTFNFYFKASTEKQCKKLVLESFVEKDIEGLEGGTINGMITADLLFVSEWGQAVIVNYKIVDQNFVPWSLNTYSSLSGLSNPLKKCALVPQSEPKLPPKIIDTGLDRSNLPPPDPNMFWYPNCDYPEECP